MPEEVERPQTSDRDYGELHGRLASWLAAAVPGSEPELSALDVPATNGMSSETVLFDVALTEAGVRRELQCVARIAPQATAVPVFPVYDLPKQYEAMRVVEHRTAVPVPTPLWVEPSPEPIGAPFFVMEKVEGLVPPDVMPYPFGDNWLFDASLDDQLRVQSGAIDVLAQLHAIPADDPDVAFL